jgi:UDP-N-acetylglucosamine acyltransferase
MGDRATLNGLNVVGLKRGGYSRSDIQALQTAYEAIFARNDSMADRLCEIERLFRDNGPVRELLSFIQGESSRALCKPKPGHGG